MAVGNINLSRVNISLAEFQRMSDGKYNAGEVKLSSETGLKKVNNHIHRLGALKLMAETLLITLKNCTGDALRAAKNPEEASAAIVRHSDTLERIASRMSPCRRSADKVIGLYREAFAREMGMSVDSEVVQRGRRHLPGL